MRAATPIERRLVLAAKLRPEDPSQNWALLSRLPAGTDPHRFATAVEDVLNTTPSFTQVFTLGPHGDVTVGPSDTPVAVPVVDYPDLTGVRTEAARYGDAVYDPSVAPLCHAEVATAGDEAYFMFAGAHVCSDGFGFYHLSSDFDARYAARDSSVPQVAEADAPTETARSAAADAVAHFGSVFAELDDLQIDGWDRRDRAGRIPGVMTRTPIEPAVYDGVGEMARAWGVRRYSVLVTALALVAGCMSESETVVIATPMANRRSGRGSEATRGVRVNTLPLRADLDPDRCVIDLVRETDRQLAEMIRFEQHAFSEFSRSLLRSESMDSTQPSVSFTLYPRPLVATVDGVRGESLGVPRRYLQYPLMAAVEVGERGATLIVERADHLPECDVAAMYSTVLTQIVRSAGRVTVGAVEWTSPTSPAARVPVQHRFTSRTVIDDVRSVVTRDRAAPALVTDEQRITYGELDTTSDRMARWIRLQVDGDVQTGGNANSVVGVALDPSVALVVTILAVFKAGLVYAPIDPSSPASIRQVARGCGDPPILVATGNPHDVRAERVIALPSDLFTAEPDEFARGDTRPTPGETAYVIFTSGTTGTPKGVRISHASAARFFDGLRDAIGGEPRRWLQSHSPVFDISLVEIFGALGSGGTVCVPRPGARRDPAYLGNFVRRHGVEVVSQTPSAFTLVSGRLRDAESVRRVLFCGERLDVPTVAGFAHDRPDVAFFNCYGITETTMYHTAFRLHPDMPSTSSTVGTPFPDVSMCVVDRQHRVVPVGVSGQLTVGGDGLMQGYLGDTVASERRIVEIDGEPVYLTGDRGSLTPAGDFTVSGRIDHQVKIRGHRCEPEAIRHAVVGTGLVDAAHVVVDGAGLTARLIAFVVADAPVDTGRLREAVREVLPRYFEPDRFVTVDALPTTFNGKVDAHALRRLLDDSTGDTPADDESEDPGGLADLVRRVWTEVLGTDDFGPDTNFFDAGGTSALVLQMGERLRSTLDVGDLDVVDLFEHHTPAALTALLAQRQGVDTR